MQIVSAQSSEYIIQLEHQESDCLKSLHLRKTNDPFPISNLIYRVNLTKAELADLKQKGCVRSYELSKEVELRKTPNDLYFSDQWALGKIDAELAWETTTGGTTIEGQDIVIAIVDKGFDIDHPDIKDNLWINNLEVPGDNLDNDNNGFTDDYFGYNINSNNDQHEPHFHGSGVMGIIGGKGNNEIGIVGVNWNVKMLLVSKGGAGLLTGDIYEMYEYVIEQRKRFDESKGSSGAYIVAINGSFGVTGAHPDSFPIWCDYMDRIGELGILYVGSTTNVNWDVDQGYDMPVSCSNPFIVGVTNSNQLDEKPFDAGFGLSSIDLAAPGDDSFTLRPGGQYGSFSGTSASSPHVAGAIGLLYSIPCIAFGKFATDNPIDAALLVKKCILQGVDENDHLKRFTLSGGRLNVNSSLKLLLDEFCDSEPKINRIKINSIFPSITSNLLFIDYALPAQTLAEMYISNTLGQVVYKTDLQPSFPSTEAILLESILSQSGTYFISIHQGKSITTKKFIFLNN